MMRIARLSSIAISGTSAKFQALTAYSALTCLRKPIQHGDHIARYLVRNGSIQGRQKIIHQQLFNQAGQKDLPCTGGPPWPPRPQHATCLAQPEHSFRKPGCAMIERMLRLIYLLRHIEPGKWI